MAKKRNNLKSEKSKFFLNGIFLLLLLGVLSFFLVQENNLTRSETIQQISLSQQSSSESLCTCPVDKNEFVVVGENDCSTSTNLACTQKNCKVKTYDEDSNPIIVVRECQEYKKCSCPNPSELYIKAKWDGNEEQYSIIGRRCTKLLENNCPKSANVCSNTMGCVFECQQIDTQGGVLGEPYKLSVFCKS